MKLFHIYLILSERWEPELHAQWSRYKWTINLYGSLMRIVPFCCFLMGCLMLDLHFWLLLSKCSTLLATAPSSTRLFWVHEAAVLGLNPDCRSMLGDILLNPPLFRVDLCIIFSGIVGVWRAARFCFACSGCFLDLFTFLKNKQMQLLLNKYFADDRDTGVLLIFCGSWL